MTGGQDLGQRYDPRPTGMSTGGHTGAPQVIPVAARVIPEAAWVIPVAAGE